MTIRHMANRPAHLRARYGCRWLDGREVDVVQMLPHHAPRARDALEPIAWPSDGIARETPNEEESR